MPPSDEITIRPVTPADRAWIRELLITRWGAAEIVTRGSLHQADELPGFVAVMAGQPVGLVTYRHAGNECEVTSLDSLLERCGIGSRLLVAVEETARRQGLTRVWLITTNDNLSALGFYQRRDYRLVAVHAGALAESRLLKPSIPLTGIDGIPLRDEIELAKSLDGD